MINENSIMSLPDSIMFFPSITPGKSRTSKIEIYHATIIHTIYEVPSFPHSMRNSTFLFSGTHNKIKISINTLSKLKSWYKWDLVTKKEYWICVCIPLVSLHIQTQHNLILKSHRYKIAFSRALCLIMLAFLMYFHN